MPFHECLSADGRQAPVLEDLVNEDKMDTSDDNKSGEKSHELATITAGISSLFRAVNVKFPDPSPLTHLPQLLGLVRKVLVSTKVTVATRLVLYERAKTMFDGLSKRTDSQGSSQYELALGFFGVLELPGGSGSETVRLKRGEAAEKIVQAFSGGVFGMSSEEREACRESMKGMAVEARMNERSPGVQNCLDRTIKALGDA